MSVARTAPPAPHLADRHRHELEVASAIAPDVIAERGYYTARTAAEVPGLFADYQRRSGLVVPIRDTTGRVVTYQLKADEPRLNADGKPIKYDTATGGRQCLDIPPRSRPHLGDPAIELWITEGAKKVDAGLSHGIHCIIGVLGVWGWRGANALGGKTALADWENIALNGRDVVLAFDSDVMTKASVRVALERLSALLDQRGQGCATWCGVLRHTRRSSRVPCEARPRARCAIIDHRLNLGPVRRAPAGAV